MIYPRQKIYGYSFFRQIKYIFLKKNNEPITFIKNFFKLDKNYKINFVFKARIGLFHILSFLIKKNKVRNKIILSSFTVFDMINMVLLSGFEPIFVDHYANSSQIDIEKLKKKVEKFKNEIGAILLTHYNVNNSELIEISNICKTNKIALIEDCAISIGSKYNNDYVGKFGDYSIFSFGFYKFINVLSGGMVFSKDKEFYNYVIETEKSWKEVKIYNLYKLIIKSFFVKFMSSKLIFNFFFPIIKFSYKKNITQIKKFLINDPNPHIKVKFPKKYKFKLSNFQINDIIFQFKNLEQKRILRAENYYAYLNGINNKKIVFFHDSKNLLNDNAYLNFPILVDDKKKFIDYMLHNNIDLNPQFYRSVDQISLFKEYSDNISKIHETVDKLVTFPTYSQISKTYINKTIDIINKYE